MGFSNAPVSRSWLLRHTEATEKEIDELLSDKLIEKAGKTTENPVYPPEERYIKTDKGRNL